MPSTKFLFWNIRRKPLAATVADLAEEHAADVVMLAENEIPHATMLLALNRRGLGFHLASKHLITTFTRFSSEFLKPAFDGPRVSVQRLQLPARTEILLAAVHFPSKLHWTEEDQKFECTVLARDIEEQEERAGHHRTVLVGDLNMNPFESGMVAAGGLHAVMSREVASRGERTVQGNRYPFFYNPKWSHLGDAKSPSAGSYFYNGSGHVEYFWNVFDQVLIRPELAAAFDPSRLQIVTRGRRYLVGDDGRPNQADYSDHLPIVFELEF